MDHTDRLEALADAAIEIFGVRCFWCVPDMRDLAPLSRAKLVACQSALKVDPL